MKPLLLVSLALTGCASPRGAEPPDPPARHRYWEQQAAQRHRPKQVIPLILPSRVEDGVKLAPTKIQISFP